MLYQIHYDIIKETSYMYLLSSLRKY